MFKRIELSFDTEFLYFNKNETDEVSYKVWGYITDTNKVDITDTSTITVFDYNAEKIDTNKLKLLELGTCIIKAFHTVSSTQEKFVDTQEIVIYESFLRDNYLTNLVSNFEKEKIQGNTFLKTIMDTCMQYFDILYAFNEDNITLKNIYKTKSKFLSELGKSMGFQFFDQENINTVLEKQSQDIYRELLVNLIDLVNIRGTKNAYQLFFSVLGYDIRLEEFWFDSDGNLVEINPDDFLITESNPTGARLSTFFRYDLAGNQIDDPPVERVDPRYLMELDNDYDRNNKSNYVRPIISVRNDLSNSIQINDPSTFSIEKRRIIKKFLEYLKPKHIQYMQELIQGSRLNDLINFNFDEDLSFSRIAIREDEPGTFPWLDMVDELYESFKTSLGIIMKESIEFYYRWDSSDIKWDAGRKWDDSEIILDNFLPPVKI